jgi:hypothetical protein
MSLGSNGESNVAVGAPFSDRQESTGRQRLDIAETYLHLMFWSRQAVVKQCRDSVCGNGQEDIIGGIVGRHQLA